MSGAASLAERIAEALRQRATNEQRAPEVRLQRLSHKGARPGPRLQAGDRLGQRNVGLRAVALAQAHPTVPHLAPADDGSQSRPSPKHLNLILRIRELAALI
jgi:hypothetical protein